MKKHYARFRHMLLECMEAAGLETHMDLNEAMAKEGVALHRNMTRNYVTGRSAPTGERLKAMMKALGLSPREERQMAWLALGHAEEPGQGAA